MTCLLHVFKIVEESMRDKEDKKTELLEMKSTMCKMKNTFDGINTRLDTTESQVFKIEAIGYYSK